MREMVPLGAADGAEENRFGSIAGGDRRFRKGRARRINGGAAHKGFRAFERKAEAGAGSVEHLERFAHDFGSDAVAGENCNAVVAGHISHPGRKYGVKRGRPSSEKLLKAVSRNGVRPGSRGREGKRSPLSLTSARNPGLMLY